MLLDELFVVFILINSLFKVNCILELLASLAVDSLSSLLALLNSSNEFFKNSHTLLTVTSGEHYDVAHDLALSAMLKHVIRKVCSQLASGNLTILEPLHAQIKATVEVQVSLVDSLVP